MRGVVEEAVSKRPTGTVEWKESAGGTPDTPVEERMMSRTAILDEIICRVRGVFVVHLVLGSSLESQMFCFRRRLNS